MTEMTRKLCERVGLTFDIIDSMDCRIWMTNGKGVMNGDFRTSPALADLLEDALVNRGGWEVVTIHNKSGFTIKNCGKNAITWPIISHKTRPAAITELACKIWGIEYDPL
jgi:hypothetical protein